MGTSLTRLNYPIKKIVEFQPYASLVELVHQASKAERHVLEELKYLKTKSFFANKPSSSTPPTTQASPQANMRGTPKVASSTPQAPQAFKKAPLPKTNLKGNLPAQDSCNVTSAADKGTNLLSAPTRRS